MFKNYILLHYSLLQWPSPRGGAPVQNFTHCQCNVQKLHFITLHVTFLFIVFKNNIALHYIQLLETAFPLPTQSQKIRVTFTLTVFLKAW